MVWIDLRDRYGITQLVFDAEQNFGRNSRKMQKIGRICDSEGTVIERAF